MTKTYKGAIYDGEHESIVDQATFDSVQSVLKHNGRTGGIEVRNKYGALLRGLLRCKACDHALVHTFVNKKSGQSYRYYRCVKKDKRGAAECASRPLPAAEIEELVAARARVVASDLTPEVGGLFDRYLPAGRGRALALDVPHRDQVRHDGNQSERARRQRQGAGDGTRVRGGGDRQLLRSLPGFGSLRFVRRRDGGRHPFEDGDELVEQVRAGHLLPDYSACRRQAREGRACRRQPPPAPLRAGL